MTHPILKTYLFIFIISPVLIFSSIIYAASRPSFEVCNDCNPQVSNVMIMKDETGAELTEFNIGTMSRIYAKIEDSSGITYAKAIIKDEDGNTAASISLYDDGSNFHGDNNTFINSPSAGASDSIFANFWLIPWTLDVSKKYSLIIEASDPFNNIYNSEADNIQNPNNYEVEFDVTQECNPDCVLENEKQCSSNRIQTCANDGEDCLHWQTTINCAATNAICCGSDPTVVCCPEHEICLAGSCVCPDSDSDGHISQLCGGDDCNDSGIDAAQMYPGNPEICDGLDNNCDGNIDETLTAPLNDNQIGVCEFSVKSCGGTSGWQNDYSSIADNEWPTEITCDGLDNNCDGTTDEGCGCVEGATQPCGSNIGECQEGIQTCSGGSWGLDCAGETAPAAEICDGLDNNCDSATDESLTVPLNDNQTSICGGSFKICNGTLGWQNDYSGIVNYENPEISCGDGIDNDCDGSDLACSATCPDGSCDVAGGECSTCAADCACINIGDAGCDLTNKSFCCGNITGNSITDIVAGEVCDVADNLLANMDLNGETCSSLGYTGGTLGCRWDCKNYDPSSCVGAPSTCGNNICDVGENASNCPTECGCIDECFLLEIGCIDLNNEWICGEAGDGDACLDKIATACVIGETCNAISGMCESAGCTEDWTCSGWSVCASGIQIQTCTDNNSCGTTDNKPDEIQSCLSLAITDPSDGFNVAQDGWLNAQAIALGGTEPYIHEWKDNGIVFGDDQQWQNLDPSTMSIGIHTISVQVTDANLSVANDNIDIEILSAGTLTASIQMWQTEFARDSMMGAMFGVDAQGGTAPYTFQWNSNIEGDFSTEQWPMIDVSAWALGTHHITIIITDNIGDIVTNTINVEIVEMSLDVWPQNGDSFIFGENIFFNANVQGGTMPYEFKWTSSKDGDITPLMDPKNNFLKNDLSEGIHTITLEVKDSSSPQITIVKNVNIIITSAPTLTAYIDSPADNSTFAQGDDISFQASFSGGVWPYTYSWDSDLDGQISADKDFIKNNLSVGNHTIIFTINDGSGQIATETINLTIISPNPIITSIASPNTGDDFYEGDSVVCFTSDVSGGVSPYIYQWNSNIDNNISDKDEFCTTNLSQGNHTITLNITDQNSDTQSDAINIILNPEPNFTNTKDMSKYSAKETFLISHKNWQNVLSLTPIAVWQGNKYPMLVYHEEGNIDIDSTIHFMQMYEPDHLTTIGAMHWRVDSLLIGAQPTGANLNAGNISNIDFNLTNYLSYWNLINSVVVVDYDNYQTGLMATVFASYKNAPIIFVNSANLADYQALIDSKVVYTVGDLDAATQSYIDGNAGTTINYSLEELQKWYIIETNTNKIILVDSIDLDNDYTETWGDNWYTTEKGGSIMTLLNRLSLAAPYLAAGKQEVILFNENSDLEKIDDLFLTAPKYQTIMASHDIIPDTLTVNYTRIAGISSADTFSYSARSLFYSELFNKIYPTPIYSKFSTESNLDCESVRVELKTDNISDNFIEAPFNPIDYPIDILEDKQFITYSGHGGASVWCCNVFADPAIYRNLPFLKLSWGSAGACLTGAFLGTKSFSYNWLRKGGIAYFGANIGIYEVQWGYATEEPFVLWENHSNIDLQYINQNVHNYSFFSMYGDATLIPIYRGYTSY